MATDREKTIAALLSDPSKAQDGEPLLTEMDIQSPLWKKIKAHLDQRITRLRQKNDAMSSETNTAKLRGRIAECKYLAALEKPGQQTDADD